MSSDNFSPPVPPGGDAHSGEDLARYVLGEMPIDERLAFEERISADDSLGRSCEVVSKIDELLFAAARRDSLD